jgi:hypothetical protein
MAALLFLIVLGFLWLVLPQDNKKVANIQYLIIIIVFLLIVLIGIYFTVALYNGWIVLEL